MQVHNVRMCYFRLNCYLRTSTFKIKLLIKSSPLPDRLTNLIKLCEICMHCGNLVIFHHLTCLKTNRTIEKAIYLTLFIFGCNVACSIVFLIYSFIKSFDFTRDKLLSLFFAVYVSEVIKDETSPQQTQRYGTSMPQRMCIHHPPHRCKVKYLKSHQ
jgi:hypothetical protein